MDTDRAGGARIVFANGCFDLLHVGHVRCLQEAAEMGDVLVVAINNDATVRQLKGDERPVLPAAQRATMVAALACVTYVVIFEEDTPHRLLNVLRPDVLVKGGTYANEAIIGRELVESYGGTACHVGIIDGVSTTAIIRKAAGSLAPQRDELSIPTEWSRRALLPSMPDSGIPAAADVAEPYPPNNAS